MKIETENLLSITNLTVTYKSGGQIIHAVNDVTFSVNKGESLGLVGETGAGKTTIAKAILRILPNPQGEIVDGKIELGGRDIVEIPEKEMRTIRGKKVSMVFQDPMTSLNPVKTVGNQIAEVIKKHDLTGKAETEKRAKEMLEMVGIPQERYKEYPHQFSGGMKQRVVIAMALANKPELLLADEPTSALDVTIQAQVMEMMSNLKDELGTSIILITHDLGVVARECDNVAVVYAGEIVEYGTKEDIFRNPQHPYTIGLFGAIPDLYSNAKRLANIPGMPPDPANLPQGCCFNPRCAYATEECRTIKPELQPVNGKQLCRCHHCQGRIDGGE